MLCSRRSGARSISEACESETNAPEAGYSRLNATSSTQNDGAPAARASPIANAAPPAKTSARRRQVTATTPSTGSTTSATKLGTESSRPISVYESPRSVRTSGHAASRAPKTSSSRSSIASSVATTPPSDLRIRSYQGGCVIALG